MKKLSALFCMFLIVMLPFSSVVYAQGEAEKVSERREVEQAQEKAKTFEKEAREAKLGIKEGELFEDILVQVDAYQPRVLRAGLLEEQNVQVYASLIGTPTNPTIKIPRIANVDVRVTNVSWDPSRKPPVRVGAIRYIPPANGLIGFRNMGYLMITVNKIPKEHDVPDAINIDAHARIAFDISETLTVSRKDLSMPALSHEEWIGQRDEYSFFAGNIRAQEITENNAVFFLYDNGGNMIRRPITLSEGATSGVLTTYFGGFVAPGLERSFDRFRIRLNKIRGMEDEVVLLINKPEAAIVKLVEGDRLYTESDWVVDDIKISEKDGSVQFKNTVSGSRSKLDFKFDGERLVSAKSEASKINALEKKFDDALARARVNLIEEPREYIEDFANAVAMYEKVIQEGNKIVSYGNYNGNLAADSQRAIYEIYKELKFIDKRIEAGETLLKNYPDVENAKLIREELNSLGSKADVKERTIILTDVGGEITVTLTKAIKAGQFDKPKGILIVDGLEREITIGSTISLDETTWSVVGFDNRAIRIKEKDLGVKSIDYRPTTVKIKDKEHSLQVKKLDFKRVAYISVLPEIKRAYSDTNFSLHIPIERRHIGLPLFSSTIDKEINKTTKLIEKLDKYIDQMQKLHKFWTNLCLITFGTVWAKNLLSGVAGLSSGPVVRQKINSEWRQKYSEERARGYRGSFDTYVLNNSAAYNADYDRTAQIINEIAKEEYKNNERLRGIGDEDKAFKEGYHYSYRKAQMDQNELTVKSYLTSDLTAQEKIVENRVEGMQGKSWTQLNEDEKAQVIEIADDPQFADKGAQVLWEDKETRVEVLRSYKKSETRKVYDTYDSNAALKAVGITDTAAYAETVNSVKKEKFPALTRESVGVSEISKQGNDYYLDGKKIVVKEKIVVDGEKVSGKIEVDGKSLDVVAAEPTKEEHKGRLTVYETGRDKGRIQRISIDAYKYAEIKYSTGGRIESIEIYERPSANNPMGGSGDKRLGEAATIQATTSDPKLKSTMSQLYSCIGGVNNELTRREIAKGNNIQVGSALGCSLGKYAVSKAAPGESGPSCVDYMDAGDCRLLFNACDPVVCPPSRCNLDGTWQVDNVIQTGIVGSTFLCLPNSVVLGGDVIMPICLTGILAGLQNIKSILQGYNQCLKKSQLEDTSVGICDRLRSYYLCEILWREASALLNTKEGVLGFLMNKVAGVSSGGGEYSKSTAAVSQAVDSVDFFTSSYAKGVFAGYSGAGFSEVGVEICKTAIFGKAPKVGDLLDSVSRPESPPQFTAFFDATPYSDIDRIPQSLYTVFYHIYAGENEDMIYSVFLRGTPVAGQLLLPPATIAANKKIKAGQYASENIEKVLPIGFGEICVVSTTKTYGTKQECGPGRVTTEFALDWLSEQYVKNQATKRINKESECVSESHSIIGQGKSVGVAAAPVAAVSTGLTQTGIVRTCSQENPGLGIDKANWAVVGECGRDNLARDLGRCWLYKPSVDNALQQEYTRDLAEKGLFKTSREVEIEGLDKALNESVLQREESEVIINKVKKEDVAFPGVVKELKSVVEKSVDLDSVLMAKYELANLYRRTGHTFKVRENIAFIQETIFELVDKAELMKAYGNAKGKSTLAEFMTVVGTIIERQIEYVDVPDSIKALKVPVVDVSKVESYQGFVPKLFMTADKISLYDVYVEQLKVVIVRRSTAVEGKGPEEYRTIQKDEGEAVVGLINDYNKAIKNERTIGPFLLEISGRYKFGINFRDLPEQALALKVPNTVDVDGVTTTRDFLSRFVEAIPPQGTYKVEVTEKEIKIKLAEAVESKVVEERPISSTAGSNLASLVAFRSGSCNTNEDEIFRIKENENTLENRWGSGVGGKAVSANQPLLFCVDRSLSDSFYVKAGDTLDGNSILRNRQAVTRCDSVSEEVAQLVNDFDNWAEVRIRGISMKKNEPVFLCMIVPEKASELLQFTISSKEEGPKCNQNAENRGYFLFDLGGAWVDDWYGSTNSWSESGISIAVPFDDNKDLVNLCVDKTKKLG